MRTLPRTLATIATATVLALTATGTAEASPLVYDPAPVALTTPTVSGPAPVRAATDGPLIPLNRADALHGLEMCATSVGRWVLGDEYCALARRVVYGTRVCRKVRSQARGRTVVRTVCRRVYTTTSGR